MSAPAGIPFECPSKAPLNTWWAWVRMVRAGERPPTREDFDAYWNATGGKMAGAHGQIDKPPMRLYKSANLLGRREFNEFRARIAAGLTDPRWVAGIDGIYWDPRKAPKERGDRRGVAA